MNRGVKVHVPFFVGIERQGMEDQFLLLFSLTVVVDQ